MGIIVTDNFSPKTPKFIDDRQSFETLEEMKNCDINLLPEGFETYCVETNKKYKFLSSNTVDPTLGKWRLVEGSGGTSIEDWVSGTDYTVGTLVIYNDKLYQCKIVPVDNTIFDKTEWQLVGTSGTIYTKTIDSTAFTLIDGVYEYEFTNPYNNKNIITSLQKEDGTLLLDTLIISDNTIKVKLNVAETVIVNIAGYELNETLIEKDALTDEQKRLLKIVSDYEKEITNLKVIETLDTDGITVLSKELQFNGEKVLTNSNVENVNLDFDTFDTI